MSKLFSSDGGKRKALNGLIGKKVFSERDEEKGKDLKKVTGSKEIEKKGSTGRTSIDQKGRNSSTSSTSKSMTGVVQEKVVGGVTAFAVSTGLAGLAGAFTSKDAGLTGATDSAGATEVNVADEEEQVEELEYEEMGEEELEDEDDAEEED